MKPNDCAPALEIFVPYWGDPYLLFATVESIRSQTSGRWAAVVVDDCYPDPAVGEHFARLDDPRIRYVRNETNLGTTGNYERCRDMASGELMMFMGCDDLLGPTFVETVLATHAAFPAASIIQTGVRVIDGNGAEISPLTDRVKRAIMPRARKATQMKGEDLAVSLLRGDWLYWPSLVFRTAALRDVSFRDDLPIIQDLALVIDLIVAGESLVLEPREVFFYRRHRNSVSATSLVSGRRLDDERRYYRMAMKQMQEKRWSKATRAARVRWTSRLHGLSLVPAAIRRKRYDAVARLVVHAITP